MPSALVPITATLADAPAGDTVPADKHIVPAPNVELGRRPRQRIARRDVIMMLRRKSAERQLSRPAGSGAGVQNGDGVLALVGRNPRRDADAGRRP